MWNSHFYKQGGNKLPVNEEELLPRMSVKKKRITKVKHNGTFCSILIYYSIMSYMFRLLFESSSSPQDTDPDIPTFTALCDPHRLHNKMCTL